MNYPFAVDLSSIICSERILAQRSIRLQEILRSIDKESNCQRRN